MKKTFLSIYIIVFLEITILPYIKTIHEINNKEVLSTKIPEITTNNKAGPDQNNTRTDIQIKKKVFMNSKSSESINNTQRIVKAEEHASTNISNATLLNLIIEQSELMKSEICKSNIEITKGLDKLKDNITVIKKKLKKITTDNIIVKDEIILDFTVCINNLNLIRVELIKMDNLLENIKKANCKESTDTQKMYDQAKNLLNKLVEGVQNFLRKTNLDFNLLILT